MNVVITGSSKGIGLGLAEEFIKAGHGVLIHGRDRENCGLVAAQLRAKYPDALLHIYACDVTCFNSMERMFWEANRFFEGIDIWINNAGIPQANDYFIDQEISDIDSVIDTNLKGTIYGTQTALKGMKDRGGFIYNMEGYGSNGMITDKMGIYGTSKSAITYFTKSISKESREGQVKIGLLSPGMVRTNLLKSSTPKDSKIYRILSDEVETVTSFLVKKILSNKKNGTSIKWLTLRKVFFRFLFSPFRKEKREIYG